MSNSKSKTRCLKKPIWVFPQRFPYLAPNEIHVWLTSTKVDKKQLAILWNILTPTEKGKTNQFKFAKLKHRFIISQGTLRFLLGKYLKIKPELIVFERNKYGKPYVKNLSTAIKFNLSHAHNLILFAFTLKHEIGVDIELARRNFPIDEISKRFFHADENQALLALPAKQRVAAFFNCWVKKEALIKAIGLGLFYALDKFNVDFSAHQSKVQIENLAKKSSWSVRKLSVPPNYLAALATENQNAKIKFFRKKFLFP